MPQFIHLNNICISTKNGMTEFGVNIKETPITSKRTLTQRALNLKQRKYPDMNGTNATDLRTQQTVQADSRRKPTVRYLPNVAISPSRIINEHT